jgi:Transposase DDE domain
LGDVLIDGMSLLILVLITNGLDFNSLERVMDRTNWDRGKRKYHFLSIGILIQGVFVPIVSMDWGQKGNSQTATRLAVLDKFLHLWSYLNKPLPTLYLLADREFIGEEWLLGLENRGVSFVIRAKNHLQFYPMIANLMGRKKFSVNVFHRSMRFRKQSQMEIVLENGFIIHLVVVENENKVQKNAEPSVFWFYMILPVIVLNELNAKKLFVWNYQKNETSELFFW